MNSSSNLGALKASLFLCEYCAQAYADESELQAFINLFEQGRIIEVDNQLCFVVRNPGFVAVIFRGTDSDSLRDWFDNAKAVLETSLDGRVHRGYKEVSQSLYRPVEKAITEFWQPDDKLYFAGHSMGAAVAALTAKTIGQVDGVFLFGCPRFADADYCDNYFFPVYRYSVLGDPVTCVFSLFRGFRHLSSVLLLDGSDSIRAVDDYWKWIITAKNIFDSLFREKKKLFSIAHNLLDRHDIRQSYVHHIKRIVAAQNKISP